MDDTQEPEVSGYTVGRLVGRGSSASVWLVTDCRTGRDFALKCFHRGPGQPAGGCALTEEAVRREILILSVLDHQHLIRAHEAVPLSVGGQTGTGLVMDYAPGGSLSALVAARGRLSVGETVTVLTPVAQALAYLHGKGFTHSDVSPGNVLFTGQGKPMLTDVGIARMLGDPGAGEGDGTPGFLDPSPVDAVRAGLQPERDVYAAAAVGWFCLTGSAPPRTDVRPPLSLLVPEVPKELAAALEAGLNEDRRLRPTALALATEVYRSAPPQPVDLACAVHPSVIPELLTRRTVQDATAGSRLRRKVRHLYGSLGRFRVGVSGPGRRMPFPEGAPAPAALGKHAARPMRGRRPRWIRLTVLPAVVALGAAAWWSLSGVGSVPDWHAIKVGVPAASASAAPGAGNADRTAHEVAEARLQAGSTDPAAAVPGLAMLRDLAFNSGRLDLLAEVNAEGSPAAAADLPTGDRLRGSGHFLAGFTSRLSDVRAEDGATAGRAVVRVTAASTAYEETDARGSVVATGAPGVPRQLRLVLVSRDGRWLVSEILPGP